MIPEPRPITNFAKQHPPCPVQVSPAAQLGGWPFAFVRVYVGQRSTLPPISTRHPNTVPHSSCAP